MQSLKFFIVLIPVALLSQAFAADPAPPPADSENTAVTEATPSSSTAPAPDAAAPAPDASSAAAKPDSEASDQAQKAADEAKRMRSLGYKAKVIRGQQMYCRQEDVIGSRFPVENCASALDIDTRTQQSKEATNTLQKQKSIGPHGS
jgi:hypothetical protein